MSFNEMGKFSEPGLLVLASLAGGPKHGYAMMEDIRGMAGVSLGPGTLYGAIVRLEERGLIEPLSSGGRRKPYRLTALGAKELEGQLKSLRNFTLQGLDRLGAQS